MYASASVLTIPVLDGVTIQFLQDHPNLTKEDYGKERLYGAVGCEFSSGEMLKKEHELVGYTAL